MNLGGQTRPAVADSAEPAHRYGDLVVRYTPALQVLGCSESYAALHGQTPAAMVGRNLAEWLPPDELDNVRAAATRPADNEVLNTNEIVRTLPDGGRRWYRWIDVAIKVGSETELLSIGMDITKVKRAKAKLRDANDELERKNAALVKLTDDLRRAQVAAEESNRAKSRFLAHMSHELRTPLNSIIGFADIMRAGLFGPVEPKRYHDYVELIHNSGGLLLSLINDVLDMSKIEAGKMEVQVTRLETAALAESCRSLVISMARDFSVVLRVEVDPDCPEIHADERAVKQMIINLMSNAVKFTKAGGIVTLSFRNLGPAGVAISVADTGIGMTPAELEKALQPFGQVDSELSRQRTGTGIGLTLVKSLVDLHHGTLDIASEKGCGTTATITLPWMKAAG